jgi:hypothetical protein
MPLRVPQFLIQVDGEFPAFIQRRFWPRQQHIRSVSASQETCEDGSHYSPAAMKVAIVGAGFTAAEADQLRSPLRKSCAAPISQASATAGMSRSRA